MSLKFSLINDKLNGMDHEFSDAAWYDFHGGHINTQDEFYDYLHGYIDNAVIYNYDCQEILDGNMEYCFEEHDIWGKPENLQQAAYCVLYDYFMDSNDIVTWADMEEVLDEQKVFE